MQMLHRALPIYCGDHDARHVGKRLPLLCSPPSIYAIILGSLQMASVSPKPDTARDMYKILYLVFVQSGTQSNLASVVRKPPSRKV